MRLLVLTEFWLETLQFAKKVECDWRCGTKLGEIHEIKNQFNENKFIICLKCVINQIFLTFCVCFVCCWFRFCTQFGIYGWQRINMAISNPLWCKFMIHSCKSSNFPFNIFLGSEKIYFKFTSAWQIQNCHLPSIYRVFLLLKLIRWTCLGYEYSSPFLKFHSNLAALEISPFHFCEVEI